MWDTVGALAPWIAMAVLYLFMVRLYSLGDSGRRHERNSTHTAHRTMCVAWRSGTTGLRLTPRGRRVAEREEHGYAHHSGDHRQRRQGALRSPRPAAVHVSRERADPRQ